MKMELMKRDILEVSTHTLMNNPKGRLPLKKLIIRLNLQFPTA